MLHVEEGQLHALLDGALEGAHAQALQEHIQACAQCAAQLEEARTLRTRSAAILGDAQPLRLATPSFESVLAQANRPSTVRRATWFSPGRLAQAAMVVLALGVGWIGRGLMTLGPGSPQVSAPATDQAAPALPPVAEPRAQLGAAESASRNQRDLARLAAPLDERAADAMSKVSEDKSKTTAREENRSVVVTTETAQRAQGTAQRQQAASPPAQQQALSQSQLRSDREVQGNRAAVLARPAAADLADAAVPLTWQYMPLERARQLVNRPVLLVPGLDIINVGVAASPEGYVVLVNQRLPDSAILELQQRVDTQPRREGFANEVVVTGREGAPAAATAGNTAALQRDGILIQARGFVSSDSLRTLLQRVR